VKAASLQPSLLYGAGSAVMRLLECTRWAQLAHTCLRLFTKEYKYKMNVECLLVLKGAKAAAGAPLTSSERRRGPAYDSNCPRPCDRPRAMS
jgi:hypothetical protein